MKKQISVASGLALLLGVSLMGAAPRRAEAGPEGRRNTTIGLGAATVGAALAKKKEAAVVLGAGTVASYVNYRKSVDSERKKQQRKVAKKASRNAKVASFRSSTTSPARRTAVRRATVTRAVPVRHPAPVPVASAYPVAKPVAATQPLEQPAPVAAVVAPVSAPAPSQPIIPPAVWSFAAGGLLAALGYGLWRALKGEKTPALRDAR